MRSAISEAVKEFSVLISIYERDLPQYFDQAMLSIWATQTLVPTEIVLVVDGKLTDELETSVELWKVKLGVSLKVLRLRENRGLGRALNEGLKECTCELVARMDADDISLPFRFEKQVAYMNSNPALAVSSAWIQEVDEIGNAIAVRKLPTGGEELGRFAKWRNPISHPASIFRKKAVLDVGGYPNFRRSQDYALWALMISRGYKFGNLQDVVLRMRAGEGLMRRRGREYLANELKIFRFQWKIGFLTWYEFLRNVALYSIVRLSPRAMKALLYKKARSF